MPWRLWHAGEQLLKPYAMLQRTAPQFLLKPLLPATCREMHFNLPAGLGPVLFLLFSCPHLLRVFFGVVCICTGSSSVGVLMRDSHLLLVPVLSSLCAHVPCSDRFLTAPDPVHCLRTACPCNK